MSPTPNKKQPDTRTTRQSGREPSNTSHVSAAKRRRGDLSPDSSPTSNPHTEEYESEYINNVREARKFLESKLLLVPDGANSTPNTMSTVLFYIAATPGVSGLTMRAIRAAAYLLEELEEKVTATAMRDAVTNQRSYTTEEAKDITEHLKGTITNEIGNQIKAIQEATKTAIEQIQTTIQEHTNTQAQNTTGQPTYSQALRRPPQQQATRDPADPRILAREGIKARQFLLDFPPTSKAHDISTTEIKDTLQKAISKLRGNQERHLIRAVERLPNKGLLIE
ncbi:hypothetical protein CPC08DRAFT_641647, partial [Agrocybe pediades]